MKPTRAVCWLTLFTTISTIRLIYGEDFERRRTEKNCGQNRREGSGGSCTACDTCDLGYGYPRGCGHGVGKGDKCESCVSEETFNDGSTYNRCLNCRNCTHHLKREYKYKCREMANSVCGACVPGYYDIHRDLGSERFEEACAPCSPNTGDPDCRNKTPTPTVTMILDAKPEDIVSVPLDHSKWLPVYITVTSLTCLLLAIMVIFLIVRLFKNKRQEHHCFTHKDGDKGGEHDVEAAKQLIPSEEEHDHPKVRQTNGVPHSSITKVTALHEPVVIKGAHADPSAPPVKWPEENEEKSLADSRRHLVAGEDNKDTERKKVIESKTINHSHVRSQGFSTESPYSSNGMEYETFQSQQAEHRKSSGGTSVASFGQHGAEIQGFPSGEPSSNPSNGYLQVEDRVVNGSKREGYNLNPVRQMDCQVGPEGTPTFNQECQPGYTPLSQAETLRIRGGSPNGLNNLNGQDVHQFTLSDNFTAGPHSGVSDTILKPRFNATDVNQHHGSTEINRHIPTHNIHPAQAIPRGNTAGETHSRGGTATCHQGPPVAHQNNHPVASNGCPVACRLEGVTNAEDLAEQVTKLKEKDEREKYKKALKVCKEHTTDEIPRDIEEKMSLRINKKPELAGDQNFQHIGGDLGIERSVLDNLKNADEFFEHLKRKRVTIAALMQSMQRRHRHDVVNIMSCWILKTFVDDVPCAETQDPENNTCVAIEETVEPVQATSSLNNTTT